MEQKNKNITYLKAVASVLITNSHCRDIYPLFFLAVGGSHGNAIFFILSGFCLANIKIEMIPWLKKRWKKVLVPVAIMSIIKFITVDGIRTITSINVGEHIYTLLNQYWFVFAIAIYYPIFYMIFSHNSKKIVKMSMICHVLIYFVGYVFWINTDIFSVELEGFAPFKVFFYFGILLLGGYIRLSQDLIIEKIRQSRKKIIVFSTVIICTSLICWAMIYAAIMLFNKMLKLQCLIHISVYTFAIGMLILSIILVEEMNLDCYIPDTVYRGIDMIANSTLEIYLIQVTFKNLAIKFVFPFNLLLFWYIAFGGGILYHRFIKFVYKLGRK